MWSGDQLRRAILQRLRESSCCGICGLASRGEYTSCYGGWPCAATHSDSGESLAGYGSLALDRSLLDFCCRPDAAFFAGLGSRRGLYGLAILVSSVRAGFVWRVFCDL